MRSFDTREEAGVEPMTTGAIGEATLAALRASPLFGSASDGDLARMLLGADVVRVAPGGVLFRQGEPATAAYVLLEGEALVIVDTPAGSVERGVLRPPRLIGEIAVLCDIERTASIASRRGAAFLRLARERFFDLVRADPEVAVALLRQLARHLHEQTAPLDQFVVAASALELDEFEPAAIAPLAERDDAVGRFARVFTRMAGEVQRRQRALAAEVQSLRIQIDEARKQKQISEITGTDYFRTLRTRARSLRDGTPAPAPGGGERRRP